MDDLPHRKNIRLQGYDYSQNGAYFVTVCIKDRHEILGTVKVGRDALGAPCVELSYYGQIVQKEILETYTHYDDVSIDKFVVMPNHVHMIIVINREEGAPRASRPTTALVPLIMTMFKKKTNAAIGFSVWQDRFFDRIIRNESEYQRICRYIQENPAKWAEDEYFIK